VSAPFIISYAYQLIQNTAWIVLMCLQLELSWICQSLS